MKVGHDICIICRGSGMVTQECICPECDGLGYVKVTWGEKEDGKHNVQKHSKESGYDNK